MPRRLWLAPSGGLVGIPGGDPDQARGFGGFRHNNIAEDEDGVASVFFESRSELVPEDTNGEGWDVYQWREGRLSLISPASEGDDSFFSGNSVNGRDVFIWTSARIDPREIDDSDYDIYDARVGGGFPYTPPSPPCDVLALACEGEAIPAPPTRSPSTAAFHGPGNTAQSPKPRCRKGQARRKGRCVKAKSKAHKHKRAHAKKRGSR